MGTFTRIDRSALPRGAALYKLTSRTARFIPLEISSKEARIKALRLMPFVVKDLEDRAGRALTIPFENDKFLIDMQATTNIAKYKDGIGLRGDRLVKWNLVKQLLLEARSVDETWLNDIWPILPKRRNFSKHDIEKCLKEQGNRCYNPHCGRELGGMVKYAADHIIPVSKGGDIIYENLGLLCASCNLEKSNKSIIEFLSQQRRKFERLSGRVR